MSILELTCGHDNKEQKGCVTDQRWEQWSVFATHHAGIRLMLEEKE
jgi:hypothetical protein